MDEFNILGISGVGVIVIICLLIGMVVKNTNLDNKWIPCIVGFCGAALGVVAMYFMPEFPGTDILTAIAIGIVSGLGSTGAHQLFKQLIPDNGEESC